MVIEVVNLFKRFKKSTNTNLTGLASTMALLMILAGVFSYSISAFMSIGASSPASRAYDFNIEFSAPEFVVEPNTEDMIGLILDNIGDSEDTYELRFKDVPLDWSVDFLTSQGKLSDSLTINVGVFDDKYIYVYVTAPKSGQGTLRVSCKSTTTQVSKTAEIMLKAEYIITITLQDKSHQHKVDAGKSTQFDLEIKNHQDITETVIFSFQNIEIKIQAYPDDFDWAVSFDNSTITLDPDKAKIVILTVFAPRKGLPGDKINIHVVAEPVSIEQTFDFPELIAEIPIIKNITYTLTQKDQLTLPNSTVNYTLKLINVGNIKSTISLMLHDNPGDWPITFFKENNKTKPEDIDIDINGIIEFRIQIKIPLDATVGSHKIIYGIFEDTSAIALSELELVTNVSLVSGIDIIVPTELSIDLGKTTNVQIMVHNKGNGLDTLNISIIEDTIPIGWEAYFSKIKNTKTITNVTKTVDFTSPIRIRYLEPTEYLPEIIEKYNEISLVLEANKLVYLTLSIVTPTSGKPTTEFITIYGESESGTIVSEQRKLSATLRVSELKMSVFKIDPALPVHDKDVIASVNVTNNFHLTAEVFNVKLSKITDSGFSEIDYKAVSNLEPGETRTIEFSYKEDAEVEEGYILEVKLIADYLTTENKLSMTVTVVEEKDEGEKEGRYSEMIMALSAAIIIAIIIFLLIWLFLSKRQSTSGVDDEIKRGKVKETRVAMPGKVQKRSEKERPKERSEEKLKERLQERPREKPREKTPPKGKSKKDVEKLPPKSGKGKKRKK